jgi:hypothetical protein
MDRTSEYDFETAGLTVLFRANPEHLAGDGKTRVETPVKTPGKFSRS